MATNATYENGTYIVSNEAAQYGTGLVAVAIALIVAGDATRTQALELTFPTDAVVDSAVFELTARAAGSTFLKTVGDVRAGDDDTQVIVDFGGMVTLQNVSAPGIDSIERWNGVEFVPAGDGELQTERVLMKFDDAVNLNSIREEARATLPAIPTGLEVAVDGTVVWSQRQGSTAGLTPPETSGVGFAVDLTAEVARAFQATGGPVRVELRSLSPGNLGLASEVIEHRVHRVAFPDGPARTITLDSEGTFDLALPLPEGSDGWTVTEVALTASAQIETSRVLPSSGPTASTDARLRLEPGRMVLGRFPDPLRDRASSIAGIRVAVRGGVEGGDLAGRLLTGKGTAVGEPVDGGELEPVDVASGDDIQWVSLRVPKTVGADATWMEIGPTFGTVDWVLTNDDEATTTPGTDIFLRTPAGAVRQLTELSTVGPLLGSARLVLEPDPDRPISALTLGIEADSGDPVDMTPATSGTACRLAASDVVHPQSNELLLTGVAAAPGTYTFSDIHVSYREETS